MDILQALCSPASLQPTPSTAEARISFTSGTVHVTISIHISFANPNKELQKH